MSHKLGTIVCKGARFGVVTKEARMVKHPRYMHEQNMIEVTWTNGKLAGKTEDMWSHMIDDAEYRLSIIKASYDRVDDAIKLARATAAKLVP